MVTPDKPAQGKEAPKPEPSRLEEIKRIIGEYADDLREIIKQLRRKLN